MKRECRPSVSFHRRSANDAIPQHMLRQVPATPQRIHYRHRLSFLRHHHARSRVQRRPPNGRDWRGNTGQRHLVVRAHPMVLNHQCHQHICLPDIDRSDRYCPSGTSSAFQQHRHTPTRQKLVNGSLLWRCWLESFDVVLLRCHSCLVSVLLGGTVRYVRFARE